MLAGSARRTRLDFTTIRGFTIKNNIIFKNNSPQINLLSFKLFSG